ncbi:FIST signal transduction protein [Marinifilum sp. D737]|uniref:FIST signal transduction protein n=1 Tax=Marinifilum sp. D737 TaxID=2969628 RepID=UPI002275215A|nr:FIST N-terminal domain-containing protein [Marinifilum sp. D737]MCY1633614.1 FIST C-terminal domain-containing protein [Marinifilum sp. D737]
MKIDKLRINSIDELPNIKNLRIKADLIFVFGYRKLMLDEPFTLALKNHYPEAVLFGCSSAGEISGTEVIDHSVVITAIEFENSTVKLESIQIEENSDNTLLGTKLLDKLDKNGLKHVMILSDGLNINGAELVDGIENTLPGNVTVTGGLAGDGSDFNETVVYDKSGKPVSNCIAALGFYGEKISVGYGSNGGWDSFGLERLVTKSKGNILYELDGKPALQLYKQFLGDKAEGLPASGLLFPLSLREDGIQEPVVRTILGVNEEDQSMTFAGCIPEGAYVRLMKANVDRLINGAENSAITTTEILPKDIAEIAILISCVGRKLVLKQLIEEEVEAVSDVIGKDVCITGFYSYGEISPFRKNTPCKLHNQTMTITTISEK